MDYVYDFTLPANTPVTSPTLHRFTLPYGEVIGVRVYFPPGCAGLAYVRVLHDELQVWPSNPEYWYHGDGIQIAFAESHNLSEDLNYLKLEGWNLDDTYPHTPIIGLTHRAAPSEHLVLPSWLSKLLKVKG